MLTQSSDSATANLFSQAAMAILFISGGFFLMYKTLAASYLAWPIPSYFPHIGQGLVDFLIAQFAWLAELLIVLGGGILIMFF